MSGIFGLFYRNQQMLERDTLDSMGASMQHRAPDGIDVWYESNVGIGNCIFHTTPESVGRTLPHIDDSGLVITADARIDAREELAELLGLSVRLRDDSSDSQLILAAYRKWHTECVNYLIGDFAFMIWDREQQQLFCARDHLGVKPFYYHLSDQYFAAASEVRAVLEVPQVPKTINEARIADFLVQQLEGVDKTSTFYESITRLPPAHTLFVSADRMLIEKYWALDNEYEVRYQSDGEYVEAFHEIFQKSVSDRLRCSGRPTSMLSGGVDSSYVVGTARQVMQRKGSDLLLLYSGISDSDPHCRETYFIKSVLAQGGVESITVDPGELIDYEQELLMTDGSLVEPFDTSMTIVKMLYLMARDRGQRVMPDGVEGDLVHSLSASYPASLFRCGLYSTALSESVNSWRHTFGKQQSFRDVFKWTIRGALIPDWLRRWRRRMLNKSLPKKFLGDQLEGSLINRDFAREVDIESRLAQLAAHSARGFDSSLREKHVKTVMHPYLTNALERYDRVAAICTVEPRHPLLDKRLVELSVGLPWDQKVRHGWSKFMIRRAGQSFLPEEVVWRRGWDDIGWQFTSALIQVRSAWMADEVRQRQALLARYLDPKMLKRIVNSNNVVASSEHEVSIWSIFQLANWLQRNARSGIG